jgi:hypothetical protein
MDRLTDIASYLHELGFIRKQTSDYQIMSITSTEIDEVERQAASVSLPPTVQSMPSTETQYRRRERRRRFLAAIYDLAGGSPNQFVYWPSVAPSLGWDAENKDHLGEALGYADHLATSGLISIEVEEGTIYRITPAGIDEVEREEAQDKYTLSTTREQLDEVARVEEAPLHIRESLQRFRANYPDPATVAFILMPFGKTKAYEQIGQAIKNGLAAHGITGIRADDKEYHEDLFPNVLTYMHGCRMGVAVFERIEEETFNPDVSLEVGYLNAIRKPLCLLKDQTLTQLHADLMGKLYREFDPYDPSGTIPPQITQWLNDRALSRR